MSSNKLASKGRFVTVEGVEGCGKTTNLLCIKQALESVSLPLYCTREPGGTPLAEDIRALLLQSREETMDAQAELMLVFAARAQHLNTCILPTLNSGTWVLSDRFTDATYAYQGSGRGLSMDCISQLERMVQGALQPDLTFFLDVDVETGMARARARGQLDRIESEAIDFFERVREGYKQRIQQQPERFIVIDASVDLPQVQRQIRSALHSKLQAWGLHDTDLLTQ